MCISETWVVPTVIADGYRSLPYSNIDTEDVYLGDLVTLRVPGDTFLILTSRDAITELLDARSNIYSGRPPFTMAAEYVSHTRILDNTYANSHSL